MDSVERTRVRSDARGDALGPCRCSAERIDGPAQYFAIHAADRHSGARAAVRKPGKEVGASREAPEEIDRRPAMHIAMESHDVARRVDAGCRTDVAVDRATGALASTQPSATTNAINDEGKAWRLLRHDMSGLPDTNGQHRDANPYVPADVRTRPSRELTIRAAAAIGVARSCRS